MKFKFWTTSTHSYIKAEFEEEDSFSGLREEGAGTKITFQGSVLEYDYPVKDIHPDILGLICLANFFPFIGQRVEFPFPVSKRLEEAFKRLPFTNKKIFEFVNVDENIPKYKGSKIGIAFGGGVDSTAVYEMFPEAYVVHEVHIKDEKIIPSATHKVVNDMDSSSSCLITTNQRYVSKPGGWHSWPCSAACLLLLASDKDIGLVLTGTVLGSNWLWNGNKFYDRLENRKFQGFSGNHWQSVFQDIGIPMFSPIDGISEYGSMRLSIDRLNAKQVNYCMLGENGEHCNCCTKCLRKSIERSLVDSSYEPDWSNYNTPLIHKFLESRPLYFGHIFKYATKKDILPSWINEKIADARNVISDWPIKYYPSALQFCPEGWEDILEQRIRESFEFMNDTEIKELEAWSQEDRSVEHSDISPLSKLFNKMKKKYTKF